MTTPLDRICPEYVGDERVVISSISHSPSLAPQAFDTVILSVDASATLPNGLMLPLELTIQAPSKENFVRRIYRRLIPRVILWRPQEAGPHLVRLAELSHNQWWGRFACTVRGDVAQPRRL